MPNLAVKVLFFVLLSVCAMSQTEPNQRLTVTLSAGQINPEIHALATAVRLAAQIRDLSVDAAKNSITFGGTPAQLDLVRSLIAELDRPSSDPLPANLGAPVYAANDGSGHVARVLYLHHTPNPSVQQETMSSVRTVADIVAIFPYWPRRALVLRSAPHLLELAEWLVAELDRPAAPANGPKTVRQYALPGGSEFVRVFFLDPALAPKQIEQIRKTLLARTESRRIFPSASLPAITFRGTAADILLAEQVIKGQP